MNALSNGEVETNLNSKRILVFCLMLALVAGCGRVASKPSPAVSEPFADYWPTESWRLSTPEQQGMDSTVLANMLRSIHASELAYHSVIVIRNGYIVLEAYGYPYQADTLHDIASATKSITSALVGIAINQGHIESVDQSVLSFFPHLDIVDVDARKEAMTVGHLLTMKSGMAWPMVEASSSGVAMFYEMEDSENWVQFLLDRPTSRAPGDYFNYSSGDSHLLSAIVQQSTGMPTAEYASIHLFEPLGMSSVDWQLDPNGVAIGGYGLRMTPREMAKFGYLYLMQGYWDDQQVVPTEWIERSVEMHSSLSSSRGSGYGYQWWLQLFGGYAARGWGGQRIYVLPDQDIVVVFTGATHTRQDDFMRSHILRAVKSSEPLPANPGGVADLQSLITEMGRSPEVSSVSPLPEIAHEITGRTFHVGENQTGWRSIRMDFGDREALLALTIFDPPDAQATEVKIGLDNVPRITVARDPWNPRRQIRWVSRGWWANEDSFLLELSIVGTSFRYEVKLTFDQEGGVRILATEMVSSQPIAFSGMLGE